MSHFMNCGREWYEKWLRGIWFVLSKQLWLTNNQDLWAILWNCWRVIWEKFKGHLVHVTQAIIALPKLHWFWILKDSKKCGMIKKLIDLLDFENQFWALIKCWIELVSWLCSQWHPPASTWMVVLAFTSLKVTARLPADQKSLVDSYFIFIFIRNKK